MNIFDVLSQGKSRLHEPAISAMLGYLLGTHRDHGLGDSFLRSFLELLKKEAHFPVLEEILDTAFIDAAIALEEPYQLGNTNRSIDIQVSILSKDNEEKLRIIIENKIKPSAANPKQLVEYYQAILEDDANISNLLVVFLTPESENNILRQEYDSLTVNNGHHKAWLRWNALESSVLSVIRSILEMEMKGEITPVNEYMRHTLKAFALHVRTVMSSESTKIRVGEDIGEIVEEISVELNDRQEYRIVRRNSQQIQVFLGDEKVTAKDILRKVIKERGLTIPLTGINTRVMGKQVLNALKSAGSSD